MQAACDANGVQLWPHIKTHKMVEVARRQLAAGATGLTCAKLGEAEAMLPSGVRRLFVAHSLVDPLHAPRIAALADALDELIVAVTSEAQAEALERVLARAGRRLPALMAVDTGLGREGARGVDGAQRLAARIAACRIWSCAACTPTRATPIRQT
jgi:D-serine deaminase-like pyridoxal phosphate-dependent protein